MAKTQEERDADTLESHQTNYSASLAPEIYDALTRTIAKLRKDADENKYVPGRCLCGRDESCKYCIRR
jgi:hypothetical protein